MYTGYIDYIPYDGAIDTVISDRLLAARPTTELHQHLLPLKEPIPLDSSGASPWRRIEGPFAHVLITSKQCISKDVIASPKSTLSDGHLTLQFIRSDDATRLKLAKTFTKLSDGKHFDYDFVQWMPIRAFRIVPDGTEGNMMVDGEKVPFGKDQHRSCSDQKSLTFVSLSLKVPFKAKLCPASDAAWASIRNQIRSYRMSENLPLFSTTDKRSISLVI